MKRCSHIYVVLLLACASALITCQFPLHAQLNIAADRNDPRVQRFLANTGGDTADVPKITVSVHEVQLAFTAMRKGRFIRDLAPEELVLIDDNQPPARIGSFWKSENSPLKVAFLVDASKSVAAAFKTEQHSAVQFLNKVLRRPADHVAVMSFTDKAQMQQDFTMDRDRLRKAIGSLKATSDDTSVFDAVLFASERLRSEGREEGPVRRAIVLITDGDDNSSKATLAEAIRYAQQSDIAIYILQVNASYFGRKSKARANLDALTTQTGGKLYEADGPGRTAPAFHKIEEELRSQYVLSYVPAVWQEDGHFRTVKLSIRRPGVYARYRPGYYSQSKESARQDPMAESRLH